MLFGLKLIQADRRDELGFNQDKTNQLDELVRAFTSSTASAGTAFRTRTHTRTRIRIRAHMQGSSGSDYRSHTCNGNRTVVLILGCSLH